MEKSRFLSIAKSRDISDFRKIRDIGPGLEYSAGLRIGSERGEYGKIQEIGARNRR